MMLQVGDDGVVSRVNEEDLIYVDKNELEDFVVSYHKLEKENEKLKQRIRNSIEMLKTEKETAISKNERIRLDFAITVLEDLKR